MVQLNVILFPRFPSFKFRFNGKFYFNHGSQYRFDTPCNYVHIFWSTRSFFGILQNRIPSSCGDENVSFLINTIFCNRPCFVKVIAEYITQCFLSAYDTSFVLGVMCPYFSINSSCHIQLLYTVIFTDMMSFVIIQWFKVIIKLYNS